MSQTLEDLKKSAEMEKTAYFNYVKAFSSAAIVELVKGGMAFEKAAEIAKEACEKNPVAVSYKASALAMEKAASHVESLEKTAGTVEVVEVTKVVDLDDPMVKLASIGFTKEEIEHMNSISDELIEKVASVAGSGMPWEMGNGVGMAAPNMDPLLSFLLDR